MAVEIKPVTRIEGDGKLELETYLVDGKLKVKNLLTPSDGTLNLPTDNGARYPKFCVTEFRGFEKFAVGEQPETVTKLVPRICGVCPVPHNMASTCAVEAAYGTNIVNNAKAVRRLMLAVHTVHSHLLHFFVLAGKDMLPHSIIDQELPNIISAHNKAQACVAVFGGKPVHPASCIPGGQTKVPNATEIGQIKARMQEIQSYAVSLLGTLKGALLALPNDFGIRPCNYMSSGVPFYSGVSGSFSYFGTSGGVVIRDSSNPTDFNSATIAPFNPENVKEEVITPYGSVISLPTNYSYTKRPYYAYNGVNYVCEVGPLARLGVAYKAGDSVVKSTVDSIASDWGVAANDILSPSTRNRHITRLIETVIMIEMILNGGWSNIAHVDSYSPPNEKSGYGVGVIEAPRGTLIHRIRVGSDLKTASYDCMVPTTANTGAFEEAVADDLVEIRPETISLLGRDPTEDEKLLLGDASRTIRGFDPCCSCSSHMIEIKNPDGTIDGTK
ncbi:MAG: nickel-dependent hydrogenase large subunit [Methanobacterium sp.]|nr:nickel-dependent hydrogenase large subunit [Methanobacterium sp.]